MLNPASDVGCSAINSTPIILPRQRRRSGSGREFMCRTYVCLSSAYSLSLRRNLPFTEGNKASVCV